MAHPRFFSRTVDGVLLGGNALFAGLWANQPALQAAGIALAALSPLLARLARSREPDAARGPDHVEGLELSDHHDFLAVSRLAMARAEALDPDLNRLLGPVPTRNVRYRALLDRMQAKLRTSLGPVLLLGPTGTGKSELARQIHELRRSAGLLTGEFVEVNCAELVNDPHLTTLFGNVKGAYTGADAARPGLLRLAQGGTLFFDEIGELSLGQQAVLLTLMNKKRYRPMGQDAEVTTDAAFVFATLRDLAVMVEAGQFRLDFQQRIDTFTYTLPSLAERPEDFDALLDFQLDVLARQYGFPVTFDDDARAEYLAQCRAPFATWPGNLRAFASSLERMTANAAQRVDLAEVEAEVAELRRRWAPRGAALAAPVAAGPAPVSPVAAGPAPMDPAVLEEAELPPSVRGKLRRSDRGEALIYVRLCRMHENLGDAAEFLWDDEPETSRRLKAERLRKALLGFGLTFETARER